jgi:hypothetical protein
MRQPLAGSWVEAGHQKDQIRSIKLSPRVNLQRERGSKD